MCLLISRIRRPLFGLQALQATGGGDQRVEIHLSACKSFVARASKGLCACVAATRAAEHSLFAVRWMCRFRLRTPQLRRQRVGISSSCQSALLRATVCNFVQDPDVRLGMLIILALVDCKETFARLVLELLRG
jgi:hypothetical protein